MANDNSKPQVTPQTIPLAKIHDLPGILPSKLPEAIAYHRGVQRQANLPVPGKLVGLEEKALPADSKTADKAAAPAAGDKAKEDAAAKETPAPTGPSKDTKEQPAETKAVD